MVRIEIVHGDEVWEIELRFNTDLGEMRNFVNVVNQSLNRDNKIDVVVIE